MRFSVLIVLGFFLVPTSAWSQDSGGAEDIGAEEAKMLSGQFFLEIPEGARLDFPDQSYELHAPSLLFSLNPLSLKEEIHRIPQGSYLVLREEEGWFVQQVAGKSWLMPDSYYRKAVTKAKQLDICQPALDKITDTSLAWQKRTYEALETCESQFDSDEALITDLTGQLSSMEARALLAEDRLGRARRTAGVAVAITGGIILGCVTGIAVAVGTKTQ